MSVQTPDLKTVEQEWEILKALMFPRGAPNLVIDEAKKFFVSGYSACLRASAMLGNYEHTYTQDDANDFFHERYKEIHSYAFSLCGGIHE